MKRIFGVFAASFLAAGAPAFAADFYAGKSVSILVGAGAGGSYDVYARTVARFMGEHIPGKPRIVPKNMTGAGSRVAANYVYNIAPKDGTILATADQSMPLEQAVGDAGITFDTRKFTWIGTPIYENNTLVTWHTSPVKTVEDAKRVEVAVGATGFNTSAQYPQVMNALLGTKFKIILGYPGGNDVNLAMERGEVGARNNTWSSWKVTKPMWLANKDITIIVQAGPKAADLPNVPSVEDVIPDPDNRQVVELLVSGTRLGRPLATTPGVPEERVKALREAFDAVMKDPDFLKEAANSSIDVDPVRGAEMQQFVQKVLATPKHLAARARGPSCSTPPPFEVC